MNNSREKAPKRRESTARTAKIEFVLKECREQDVLVNLDALDGGAVSLDGGFSFFHMDITGPEAQGVLLEEPLYLTSKKAKRAVRRFVETGAETLIFHVTPRSEYWNAFKRAIKENPGRAPALARILSDGYLPDERLRKITAALVCGKEGPSVAARLEREYEKLGAGKNEFLREETRGDDVLRVIKIGREFVSGLRQEEGMARLGVATGVFAGGSAISFSHDSPLVCSLTGLKDRPSVGLEYREFFPECDEERGETTNRSITEAASPGI